MDHCFSRVQFTPGFLTLCGCNVSRIEWKAPRCKDNERMWTLIDQLSDPCELSHQNFVGLLNTFPLLWLCSFSVTTDSCRIDVLPGSQSVTITHANSKTIDIKPRVSASGKTNDTAQLVNVALHFINIDSEDAINRKLAKMKMLAMLESV